MNSFKVFFLFFMLSIVFVSCSSYEINETDDRVIIEIEKDDTAEPSSEDKDIFIDNVDTDPMTGIIYFVDENLLFYDSGKLKQFKLASDFILNSGKTIQADTIAVLAENGNFISYILKVDWFDDDGMGMKAGFKVISYEEGMDKSFILANDFTFDNGMIAKKDDRILFYKSGKIQQFTLANDFPPYDQDTVLVFDEDGKVIYATMLN